MRTVQISRYAATMGKERLLAYGRAKIVAWAADGFRARSTIDLRTIELPCCTLAYMAHAKFDPKVQKLLSTLNEQIFRLVHERIEDGSLLVHREAYILRPNFSLRYSVDATALNFGLEEGSEEACDYTLLENLVLTPIKSLPEFQSVAARFSPESRELDALQNFVSTVALEAIRASTPDHTARHIDTVLSDFQDKERDYSVKIWLNGITLTDDRVTVSSDLSFRRPSRSDLQERVTSKTTHYVHAFRTQLEFSCIADMAVRCDWPIKVQLAVQKLVIALQLFRLGSVVTSRYELEAKSFSPFNSCAFSGPSRSGPLTYNLSAADGAVLSHFLQRITGFLPALGGLSNEKPNFLTTALHWYEEAVLGRFQPEAAVGSAVACLACIIH